MVVKLFEEPNQILRNSSSSLFVSGILEIKNKNFYFIINKIKLMKRIKYLLGETLYWLFIPLSLFFLIIVEILSILYNFFNNLFMFRKIS